MIQKWRNARDSKMFFLSSCACRGVIMWTSMLPICLPAMRNLLAFSFVVSYWNLLKISRKFHLVNCCCIVSLRKNARNSIISLAIYTLAYVWVLSIYISPNTFVQSCFLECSYLKERERKNAYCGQRNYFVVKVYICVCVCSCISGTGRYKWVKFTKTTPDSQQPDFSFNFHSILKQQNQRHCLFVFFLVNFFFVLFLLFWSLQ